MAKKQTSSAKSGGSAATAKKRAGVNGTSKAGKANGAKAGTTKSGAAKRGTGKRELIKPKGDARFVRRDAQGRIRESDDVGRSLKQDRARKAKTTVKSGQGDKGDRPTKARKK